MKGITAKDLYQFSFYGNLKCKKNSTIFVQARMDEEKDTYLYDLMLFRKGKMIELTSRHNVSSYQFQTPKKIWFSTPDENETILNRLVLNEGEARELVRIEKKNGTLLGFLNENTLLLQFEEQENEERDPVHPDYEVLDETPWYFNGVGFVNKKRSRLYTYSLAEKRLSSCLSKDICVSLSTIHEGKIYFTGQIIHTLRKEQEGIYVYDPTTDQLEELIAPDQYTIYSLDWVKDKLMVFASDGHPIGLNSNPRLYAYNDQQKVLEQACSWDETLGNTVGTDCAAVGGNAICVANDKLYFTSTVVSHNNLYCYENGTIHQVLEWPGTIHSFGIGSQGLYFIGARPNELQQLFFYDGEGEVRQLSTFNQILEDRFVSQTMPVFYTGYEGSQQMGWVLYPKDFNPEKKYPAILDIHGGPKTVYGTVFYHEMQLWASQGYFVFFCNPFGSDGQGDAYANMCGRYGSQDYEDLMNFTDAVLHTIPQIDENRVGVTGGSYGGFMTNWIIGHTNRFKAAASQRSISNWLSFIGTSDIGPEFTVDQQGSGLEDPMNLWNHSPIKYVDQVQTPTLFIHSDEDYRCPLEQGLQMCNGLLTRGVPARLVMFRKENHELSRSGKPSHRLRRLEEITSWMNQYLKPESQQSLKDGEQ